MENFINFCFRFSASTLAIVYFFTQVAAAYTPETTLWADRRRQAAQNRSENKSPLLLASLPSVLSPGVLSQPPVFNGKYSSSLSDDLAKTLPKTFVSQHAKLLAALHTAHGTIRKVWLPTGGAGTRVVIHIQDVHQNQDAQRHIRGAVASLTESQQVGLVALEGAFAPIDVSLYHDFDDREIIDLTADGLLRENLITGPVHAAMTTRAKGLPLLGIDDPAHYNANVNAYRQSVPRVELLKQDLLIKKTSLEQTKRANFSPALAAFDAKVVAYKEQRIPLSEYVEALAPGSREGHVGRFIQAFAIEKKLDFQKVESDRKNLVAALVNTLTKPQVDQLVQESAAYRLGQIRYGKFYGNLKSLCESVKLDLGRYPHMDAYIRYVLASDQIDGEKLMDELVSLQKERYRSLAKTPQEQECVSQSTTLQLTEQLLNFSLTPAEWADYERGPKTENPNLSTFEAFYREAHARDGAMVKNLINQMNANKVDTAALVTGGYHAPGIDEQLRQAGVTVIVFTPRIEKVDTTQGAASLSVFTQEKTPLEKLFAGEKLFLSQNPAKLEAGALLAVGVAAKIRGIPAAKKTWAWFRGATDRITIALDKGWASLVVKGKDTSSAVRVIVKEGPEGFSFTQKTIPLSMGLGIAVLLYPALQTSLPTLSMALLPVAGSFLTPGLMVAATVLLIAYYFRPNTLFLARPNPGDVREKRSNVFSSIIQMVRRDNGLYITPTDKKPSSLVNETAEAIQETMGRIMRVKIQQALNDQDLNSKIQSLKLLTKWGGLEDNRAALQALVEVAFTCSETQRETIRTFIQARAKEDLVYHDRQSWIMVNQVLTNWSNRTPVRIGESNFTDWHILVLVQFFLRYSLQFPYFVSILGGVLAFFPKDKINLAEIKPFEKTFNMLLKEGVHFARTIERKEGKQTVTINEPLRHHSLEKAKFADKFNDEQVDQLANIFINHSFPNVAMNRFLYHLQSVFQECYVDEQKSAPSKSPLDKNYIEAMMGKLEERINSLPQESHALLPPPSPPQERKDTGDSSGGTPTADEPRPASDEILNNLEMTEVGSLNSILQSAELPPEEEGRLVDSLSRKFEIPKTKDSQEIYGALLKRLPSDLGTATAAVIPLPLEILNDPKTLEKVLSASSILHKAENILYLVETPADLENLIKALKSRTAPAEHVPGLFTDHKLNLSLFESKLPHEGRAFKLYQPNGYALNLEGVTSATEKRLKERDIIVPLVGLVQMIERLWRIAEHIAQQA